MNQYMYDSTNKPGIGESYDRIDEEVDQWIDNRNVQQSWIKSK